MPSTHARVLPMALTLVTARGRVSSTCSSGGCQTARGTGTFLDIGFAIMQKRFPGRSTSQVAKGLWASPSQCVSQSPWSHSLATPTTSLEIYSYEKDWVLSGDSMLRLLGWPENRFPVEIFSNHELRCLSGESFSIPIVTQLIMASYPFAPWWQE